MSPRYSFNEIKLYYKSVVFENVFGWIQNGLSHFCIFWSKLNEIEHIDTIPIILFEGISADMKLAL